MQIVSKHIMVHIIRRTVCQIDVVVVNLNIFPMWITWGYAATIMDAEHESSEYWHLDIIQWIAFLPIIKILSSDAFNQFISDAMINGETFVFEDLMWLKKISIAYINVISQDQSMPCKFFSSNNHVSRCFRHNISMNRGLPAELLSISCFPPKCCLS